MESLSLESTIESPTKPHQEKAPDKDKKSMFLINAISDEKIKEQEEMLIFLNYIQKKIKKKKIMIL